LSLFSKLAVVALVVLLPAARLDAALPANFSDALVASVGAPTALAFLPDGRLLVTTQGGSLRVISGGALLPTPALTIPAAGICANSERGMLGIAVDPAYPASPYLYVYYTANTAGGCVNRLSRFTLPDGLNTVTAGSEQVLVDNMPSTAGNHNGGDVKFGKDGTLFATVGDGGCDYAGDSGCAGSNDASRDQQTLTGKLLRIHKDGSIPADNPFLGAGTARCNVTGRTSAGNKCQETFAWGFRNPFRFAFDPNAAGNRIFANDVGQGAWEEVDDVAAGADYGWNCREGRHVNSSSGKCSPTPPAMVDPVFEYSHSGTVPGTSAAGCASITGGAFVPNGLWPAVYDGAYLAADYVCGAIFRLTKPASTWVASDFATNLGGSSAVTLLFGPNGNGQALYYTTYASGGQVRRISYSATGNNPPTAAGSATPQQGGPPLSVTFSLAGSSDPDSGDVLTYFFDFGDGQTAQQSTPALLHTYVTAGVYNAVLRVRDDKFSFSNPLSFRILVGNDAPAPGISSPAAGAKFRVGQTVTLTGSATDPQDGTLPDSALSWTVLLHHDVHTHPFLGPVAGNNVAFTAPAPEDFAAAETSYLEIRLTATDSATASTTVTRDFQPNKQSLTLATSPAGLTVTVNGAPVTGPTTAVAWEGWALTVDAASPQPGPAGAPHLFASWTDGGARSHTFQMPASALGLTASFVKEGGTRFHTLTPCRAFDSRTGGGPLPAGAPRNVTLAGVCGIPPDAAAVSANLTVVQPTAAGFLQVLPPGLAVPVTSRLNFAAGQTRANNATLSLLGSPSGVVALTPGMATGTVHVVLDVNGYFR
jgi:glucose/arabinose dehydrogenase